MKTVGRRRVEGGASGGLQRTMAALRGTRAVVPRGVYRFRSFEEADLLIDPSPDNIARVRQALRVLEDHAVDEVKDEDVAQYSPVRVADEIVVDLMGAACGVGYAEAVADAETFHIEGVAIPVASLGTLIRTKNTLRPLDAADRAYLQALLESEQPPTRD